MARKEKPFKGTAPRPIRDVVEERALRGAELRNYGGGRRRVLMEWDLNAEAIADQVFKLTVGSEEAYLDAEELRRYLRWV